MSTGQQSRLPVNSLHDCVNSSNCVITIQFYSESFNILFIYKGDDKFFEYFKLIGYLNHNLLSFRCNEFVNGKVLKVERVMKNWW